MKPQSVFRVRIEDIKYNYYDKTGVTKCTIRWRNPFSCNIQKTVGTAKRNPKDEPNEVLGCRIAESRAKIRMWKDFRLSVKQISSDVDYKHTKLIFAENRHLLKLIRNA